MRGIITTPQESKQSHHEPPGVLTQKIDQIVVEEPLPLVMVQSMLLNSTRHTSFNTP
jgi:hypothetical protein